MAQIGQKYSGNKRLVIRVVAARKLLGKRDKCLTFFALQQNVQCKQLLILKTRKYQEGDNGFIKRSCLYLPPIYRRRRISHNVYHFLDQGHSAARLHGRMLFDRLGKRRPK